MSSSSDYLEPRLVRRLALLRACSRRLRLDRVFHELAKFTRIDDASLAQLIHAQRAGAATHQANRTAGSQAPFYPAEPLLDRARRQLRVKASRFHQQPCTVQTALDRAALIKCRLQPGSRIACLGDDDFTSLALAASASNPITVLDLDKNVLAIIRSLAAPKSYPISVRLADLTKTVPSELRQAFDIVFTDPPYDFEGLMSFLIAAESVLKRSAISTSFLMFCCCAPLIRNQWPVLLEWVGSKGLRVEEVAEGFNEYPKTRRPRLLSKAMRLLCSGSSTARQVLALPHVYSDLVILSARLK